MEDVISVFGSFDQNLRMIETEYNVRVTDRDEQIHITGEAENVLYAEKAIAGLLSLAAKGEEIGEQNVRYIFRLVREGREQKIQELAGDVVCITAKGKPIKAKTLRTTPAPTRWRRPAKRTCSTASTTTSRPARWTPTPSMPAATATGSQIFPLR